MRQFAHLVVAGKSGNEIERRECQEDKKSEQKDRINDSPNSTGPSKRIHVPAPL